MSVKTPGLLSWRDILQNIRQKQSTVAVKSDTIHSFQTGHFPANRPTEDRHVEARLLPSGAYLFAVFDGHSGWQCAQQLEERLPRYVSAALANRSELKRLNPSHSDQWASVLTKDEARLGPEGGSSAAARQEQERSFERYYERRCMSSEDNVEESLKKAFVDLDDSLSQEAQAGNDGALEYVSSGAVGLAAVIHDGEIIVANTGDCRAVLGVKTKQGTYTALPLSRDHDAGNPAEVARLRASHPGERVIFQERLLGMLQPFRAFGDVLYKWRTDVQAQLFGKRHLELTSPPYLTAEPEITRHRLTSDDAFLVIATDGLWSVIPSQDVVQHIALHSEVLHNVAKPPADAEDRGWEENAATHLVLRSIGPSRDYISKVVNIPGGMRRSYYDDSTVTVIFFNSGAPTKSKLWDCVSKENIQTYHWNEKKEGWSLCCS